ncbi:MAG: helix-turn-helix domain-containing protein [Candidatus Gracilibacteria bacterium]|nr:helix-turn-helix domain-containing protein [Candidatus Gracilibacteria bacterium]
MKHLLEKLGWKEKEISCYLCLLEYGQQPASVIAKKLSMPKATVLFVLHRLVEKSYVRMSKRGKTEYFYADPNDLEASKKQEMESQLDSLIELVPLLQEYKNPLTSPPKLNLFEGVMACKNAYAEILNSTTNVLEFATHDDLAEKFGEKWMDNFISQRVKNQVFMRSVCHDTPTDRALEKLDKIQLRETKFVPEKSGKMYSCIALYEDKLLMLNLGSDAFGILIQNASLVETMKTIHGLTWSSKDL